MTAAANLAIDGARLWRSLEEMAEIGPGVAGGSNRQALTDADGEGRALFARWCGEAGLTLGVDQMGTMFYTREGTDPDALPVYFGSHLDTQPTGGRYDGVLGVLAGLEVMRTLNERGIRTRHPLVLVNWSNEEGARFAPSMLASGVFAGIYDLDYALARPDPEGRPYGEELARIGWKGDEAVGARKMHAYYELHIEQGPILEAEGLDIGVVTHGQGLWWLEFTLTGRAAHTGSTPMAMRVDAGLAMARIVDLAEKVATTHQPDVVAGVGQVFFRPNSRNVLPETVTFTVDIRSPDAAKLASMRNAIESGASEICAALGVGCAVEVVGHFEPVPFAPELLATIRAATQRLGYSHRDIVSGAGHDACFVADVAPAAMIFCPCEGGISHNEAEAITPDWAAKGTQVLLHAVLETAGVDADAPVLSGTVLS